MRPFLTVVIMADQGSPDPDLQVQLRELLPMASAYPPKEDAPALFEVYATDAGSGRLTVVGYAFRTAELEPLGQGECG